MTKKTKHESSRLTFKDSRAERRKAENEANKTIPAISMENMLDSISSGNIENLKDSISTPISPPSIMPTIKSNNPHQNVEASKRIDKYRLSYIEEYEEDEARRQIEELLGFETPRVCGWHMVVKIYVRPEEITTFIDDKGNSKSLYMPTQYTVNDKFMNCTALVIAKGAESYTGKRFSEHWFIRLSRVFFNKWMKPSKKQPWCRVGDWIVFPRNEGPQLNYRGIPVQVIPDDKCYMIIEDPTHVTRD